MSVQDELLSFQIKETIFLSSDKANIGEMKELEIVPDVEIIENNNEISITGCLQLHGRYEPARNAQATQTGGTDSLLEAMKFTPFQLQDEEAKRFLQGNDAELVHRIPLNVSIPLSRIEDLSDIYAIIDSFDYEVKTPHQLQIQADLKIAGIHLKSQTTSQQAELTPAGTTEQESWEFVHVANTPEEIVQPTSLEEIERKLAELEREVESREHYQASHQSPSTFGSTPFVSAPYQGSPYPASQYPPTPYASAPYTPAPFVSEQAKAQSQPQPQPYNPWAYQVAQPTHDERESAAPFEAVNDMQAMADSYTEFGDSVAAVHAEPYAQPDLEPEDEQSASPGHISVSIKEQDKVIDFQSVYDERQASIEENQDAPLEVEIASDTESAGLLEAQQYPEELAEEVNAEEVHAEEAQIEEVHAEEAHVEEAHVEETHVEEAHTEAEVKEMRVAIGSKPTKEKNESLSITSLFTNAGRPKTEQAVEGRSVESSASSRREVNEVVRSSAAELKSGLTSFVRDNEQQFSRLKMCIIQREETIQMIADRYALPVSKLVEVNRLSSDRIAEGQVLYIPQ